MPDEPKKILTKDEESRLVFLAKQGDSEAYSELFSAFEPLLQSIVKRHTPGFWNKEVDEDLHGAAVMGFSQAVAKFQPNRNRRLATLAHLEIRRCVMEVIRSNTKSRVYTSTEKDEAEFYKTVRQAFHPVQDGELESREPEFEGVDAALAKLSERERHVVRSLFFEGRNLADVARDLQISLGAARTEYARVLSILREELA